MISIQINETHAVKHPFFQERVIKGKRPGTREFVASIDGLESGLLIFEHFPERSLALVYEIYVLAESRGLGVGNRVLSHAQAVAVASGCEVLGLWVRSLDQERITDNDLSSWYGRNGFERETGNTGWMQMNLVSARTKAIG